MATVMDGAHGEQVQRRMAGALAARGLTEGDRVALCTTGSVLYVAATLAATRTGIVPVPVDPRVSDWERDRILGDADAAWVIDSPDALAELDDGPITDLAPAPLCRPMHFTSGTTGRPKGVWSGLLSAEHAAALVAEERDLWGFCADDRHLVVSPLYHSAPLRFAAGTLLAGGSISVLSSFDPAAWATAVAEVRPTSMFCAPAHLQRIIAWLDDTGATIDVDSFRLVAHAGAPCPEGVRRRAHELFGRDVVWEFYGSTEGQFTACPAPDWYERPGSVGRVRPGRSMRVDDEGQLWCSVPAWARFTYWRDADKTAQSWREGPDGPEFTVGDLGRVDGDWVYLDSRRTDLIITGGVNVYPLEVEAAMDGVPGLVDIAVHGVDDSQWGQRVVASYVGDVDPNALRDRAVERLSPPKRPKEYRRLDALPRTATGKVLRTHL